MTTIIIILFSIFGLYTIYRSVKPVNVQKAKQEFATKSKQLEKEIAKQNTYPRFIPFYEWHGFLNGLHPENRLYVLSGGKKGRKPKKWKV